MKKPPIDNDFAERLVLPRTFGWEPGPTFILPLNDGAVLKFFIVLEGATIERRGAEFNSRGQPIYVVDDLKWRFEVLQPAPGDTPRPLPPREPKPKRRKARRRRKR